MKYHESILDLIGHTPMVRLSRMVEPSMATVLVKLEQMNPGGSVKDRMALHMIRRAEERGLIKPGATCSGICAEINRYFDELDLLRYRTFGYGHSFGVLSHYYGREAGLELREDVDTVLEAGMVVSMEPMLTLPQGLPGAGGYREHDILVVGKDGAENITGFPYGPEHNILAA